MTIQAIVDGDYFINNETPSGTVDGVNTSFTLANTPVTGSVRLFEGGRPLDTPADYSMSGNVITLTYAPPSGSYLRADYRKSVI